MTRFYLSAGALGRWMHQNKAQYTGAYVECVLVDSFVVETKRGVAAIYEHALNEWTSNYYVEFTDYKNGFNNGEINKIWSDWYAFEEKVNTYLKKRKAHKHKR